MHVTRSNRSSTTKGPERRVVGSELGQPRSSVTRPLNTAGPRAACRMGSLLSMIRTREDVVRTIAATASSRSAAHHHPRPGRTGQPRQAKPDARSQRRTGRGVRQQRPILAPPGTALPRLVQTRRTREKWSHTGPPGWLADQNPGPHGPALTRCFARLSKSLNAPALASTAQGQLRTARGNPALLALNRIRGRPTSSQQIKQLELGRAGAAIGRKARRTRGGTYAGPSSKGLVLWLQSLARRACSSQA